jgi:hypothetical protein
MCGGARRAAVRQVRSMIALLLASLAGVAALLLRPAPAIQADAVAVERPADARTAWAVDLLRRLGNDAPDAPTVGFVVAWTVAEDACMSGCGYSSAWERYNPLNTTQEGHGAYATVNGDGVKAYPDYESGMAATVQTLSYSYYTEIVAGLQTNDPERALRGLYGSPWGTSAAHVEQLWRAE